MGLSAVRPLQGKELCPSVLPSFVESNLFRVSVLLDMVVVWLWSTACVAVVVVVVRLWHSILGCGCVCQFGSDMCGCGCGWQKWKSDYTGLPKHSICCTFTASCMVMVVVVVRS